MSVVWTHPDFPFPRTAVAIRKAIALYSITKCQECLCGDGTKQRPELLWVENKMLKS